MKCLSIQQPWAWLIIHGGKDIENRSWRVNYRGRILIHAGKKIDPDYVDFAKKLGGVCFENRGGIIGSVEITNCVDESPSEWFCGPFGFVLKDPKPLPLIPYKGQLGLFDVAMPGVCRICGCHDLDCSGCIERTGEPCYWVEENLCSACASVRL